MQQKFDVLSSVILWIQQNCDSWPSVTQDRIKSIKTANIDLWWPFVIALSLPKTIYQVQQHFDINNNKKTVLSSCTWINKFDSRVKIMLSVRVSVKWTNLNCSVLRPRPPPPQTWHTKNTRHTQLIVQLHKLKVATLWQEIIITLVTFLELRQRCTSV